MDSSVTAREAETLSQMRDVAVIRGTTDLEASVTEAFTHLLFPNPGAEAEVRAWAVPAPGLGGTSSSRVPCEPSSLCICVFYGFLPMHVEVK